MEPEKEVVGSSSETRTSTKIEPPIAPVNEPTLPVIQVSIDAREDGRAEKSRFEETVSKDNDAIMTKTLLEQVQKDDDMLGKTREVTSTMDITKEESASSIASKSILEQPHGDEKLKEVQIASVQEDIQPNLMTEPRESTSSKPQETVLGDDKRGLAENMGISNKPAAGPMNEKAGESGVVSELAQKEEDKEEKMEVEEAQGDSVTMTLEISQAAKQPEGTKDSKESKTETETAVESNVSPDISKENTTKLKDSQISEISEGTSEKEDLETFKGKSLSSYDNPSSVKEDEVKGFQETSGNPSTGLILPTVTSKEHPDTQNVEMTKPTCTSDGLQQSTQKPAADETTDSSLPEGKDFDGDKQIAIKGIPKDLPKEESSKEDLESAKVAKMQVDLPLDTKETSAEQEKEMETAKDVEKVSDVSTSKADTDDKQTPVIPMEVSQTEPKKKDSEEIDPMDATEAIHESGKGNEALVDTSVISADPEKHGAKLKDTLESQSENQASVTDAKVDHVASNDSSGKNSERDDQTRSLGNKSKSDKEESPKTNQCTPVPSIVREKKPLTEEQKASQRELIDVCIHGLEHCLLRFPQHHKSRYRLAYVYYVSPYHKVSFYGILS